MEESHISDDQKDIQNINQKIFLHLIKPTYLPVGFTYESIQNLSNLIDSSYEEIYIGDLLDYIDYNESMALLDLIKNKLNSGGAIIVQSSDLYALSSAVVFGDIDIQTSKLVIYNEKKSMYTMHEIETELKNRQLSIIEKKYINIFEYYIKAIKNV